MPKPIRLLIVEDQEFMAKALQAWLATQPDCVIVGCAVDGKTGWELCQATQPDVALVDIQMPQMNGFEFAKRLLAELPRVRLLFMSGLVDPHTVFQVTQSRAHGYVSKTHSCELLMTAIRTVAAGQTYFCPSFQQVKKSSFCHPEAFEKLLSDREQEVLKGVASGQNDELIGQQLRISPSTVGVHRKNIRKKLNLHNDRDLLAYARQWGLKL